MKNDVRTAILAKFPKTRPVLPPEYLAIYESHYRKNREGATRTTSLSKKLESWLHKKVAQDLLQSPGDRSTLEIGAGTLNQLAYEPPVTQYDIVEPFDALYAHSTHKHRISKRYRSIHEIPAENTYRRITAIAAFEHIEDLPAVLARAALLLDERGELRASIPNEGTIMWKMGTWITGAEFKKTYGLDYQVLMKHEHINTAREIEAVLRYFFEEVSVRIFGLCRALAFYRFFRCSHPNKEKAETYLKSFHSKNIRP
jgi:hypothetical protein